MDVNKEVELVYKLVEEGSSAHALLYLGALISTDEWDVDKLTPENRKRYEDMIGPIREAIAALGIDAHEYMDNVNRVLAGMNLGRAIIEGTASGIKPEPVDKSAETGDK